MKKYALGGFRLPLSVVDGATVVDASGRKVRRFRDPEKALAFAERHNRLATQEAIEGNTST